MQIQVASFCKVRRPALGSTFPEDNQCPTVPCRFGPHSPLCHSPHHTLVIPLPALFVYMICLPTLGIELVVLT